MRSRAAPLLRRRQPKINGMIDLIFMLELNRKKATFEILYVQIVKEVSYISKYSRNIL